MAGALFILPRVNSYSCPVWLWTVLFLSGKEDSWVGGSRAWWCRRQLPTRSRVKVWPAALTSLGGPLPPDYTVALMIHNTPLCVRTKQMPSHHFSGKDQSGLEDLYLVVFISQTSQYLNVLYTIPSTMSKMFWGVLLPLQIIKLMGAACKRQTLRQTAIWLACLQSGPWRLQSQAWSGSGSLITRCGVCSSSCVSPGRRTNSWRTCNIATWWHCSTSKTQRTVLHRWVCGFSH